MKKFTLGILVGALVAGSIGMAEARPNYNQLTSHTGVLEVRDGDDFYVDGMELELGYSRTIGADYNQDGTRQMIKQELYGLVGKTVTVKGYRDHDHDDHDELHVIEINGIKYPNSRVHHNHR